MAIVREVMTGVPVEFMGTGPGQLVSTRGKKRSRGRASLSAVSPEQKRDTWSLAFSL